MPKPKSTAWNWSAVAASGLIAATVGVTGYALAKDNEPEKPKATLKKPTPIDDSKPIPPPPPGSPAAAGEERPPVDPVAEKLKKQIQEALAEGDQEKVTKLVAELDKHVKSRSEAGKPGAPQLGFAPPGGLMRGLPGAFRAPFAPPAIDDNLRQMRIEMMRKSIEQAARNMPEEVRKAMIQDMERMIEAMANPLVPGVDVPAWGGGFGRAVPGDRRDPGFRLGVTVAPVEPALAAHLDLEAGVGVLVTEVSPKSLAEQVGLKVHDLILSLDDKPVMLEGDNAITKMLDAAKPGDKLNMVILRKGEKQTKSVKVPERKAEPDRPKVGQGQGFGGFGGFGGVVGGLPENFQSMAVSINNNEFDLQATQDGVRYQIIGEIDGKEAVPSQITIKDGGEKAQNYDSIDAVPKEFRDSVSKLLESILR